MTPELALKLSQSTVNNDIYEILKPVFDRYSGQDIANVIAKIRGEIELAKIGVEKTIYDYASANKSIENVSQGSEKPRQRRTRSKTNTEQDR